MKTTPKQARKLIPEILKLCIEKNLNFEFKPRTESLSVYRLENKTIRFHYTSYYSESLINYSDKRKCFTVTELLEKIKELDAVS